MRIAFGISFIANIALALVSLVVLPDRVAVHFGRGGFPNGWAPGTVHSLTTLGIYTFLFFALYFAPRLTSGIPAKWVNLPHKDFWLAPENRPRAEARIARLMFQFGTAVFLFLFVCNLLVLQANLADPVKLDERVLFPFLLLFLGYILVWGFQFYRSFRLPKGKVAASPAS